MVFSPVALSQKGLDGVPKRPPWMENDMGGGNEVGRKQWDLIIRYLIARLGCFIFTGDEGTLDIFEYVCSCLRMCVCARMRESPCVCREKRGGVV